MAADGGIEFSVRLVNQVMGPAKQIQKQMKDVTKAFQQARAVMEAPSPRRSPVSQWDKQMAAARRSQAKDFARHNARLAKLNQSQGMGLGDVGGGSIAGMGLFAGIAATIGGVTIAALAAVRAVAELGVQFAQAAVEAAAFAQRSRMALTFLIGNAPIAAQQFDALRKEAAGLGLDVQQTQHDFQKLLAAQFEIGKARELVRMGADLQAIGATAEDVSGVLRAMTQIKSKNRLQAEEMLQLQERGISAELVYAALGKQLGKTRKELQQMQLKGQIGGTEAIEAILAAVRTKTGADVAGDVGKAFAESTIVGMAGVFKGKIANLLIDVGDAILPGLTRIATLVSGTFNRLLGNGQLEQFGKSMFVRWERFVAFLDTNWPQIEGMLVTGLDAMQRGALLLADGVELVINNWAVFKPMLLGAAAWIGFAVAATIAFWGTIAVVAGALLGFVGQIVAQVSALGGLAVKAFKWGADLVGNYLAGMKSNLPNLISLMSAIPGMGGAGMALALSGIGGPVTGVRTAADYGPAAGLSGVLGGIDNVPVTVAAEPAEKVVAGPTFNQSFTVAADVDQDSLVTKIRSAFTQALEEAST